MNALRTLSHWQTAWLPWFPVTGGGWTIGLIIASAVAKCASLVFSLEASLVIAGVLTGAILGLVQLFALHPDVKGIGAWVTGTGIGWVAGLGITTLVVMGTDSLWGTVPGAILGSLAFGFAQWLVLSPEMKYRRAWLCVTIAGWTTSMSLGLNLGGSYPNTLIDQVVRIAEAGAVGVVILGLFAIFAMCLSFPTYGEKDITNYVRWLP